MRFYSRDLLWFIAVVGCVLAWFVSAMAAREAYEQAEPWRRRAGALEHFLKQEGWDVEWRTGRGDTQGVFVTKAPHSTWVSTVFYEPGEPRNTSLSKRSLP